MICSMIYQSYWMFNQVGLPPDADMENTWCENVHVMWDFSYFSTGIPVSHLNELINGWNMCVI